MKISSWWRISFNAEHYYGTLYYYNSRIELKYLLTKQQAKYINNKDKTTSISHEYKEGEASYRFKSEKEVIEKGIEIFEKFLKPQGFNILIEGSPSILDPQHILYWDNENKDKANELYKAFDIEYGWDCPTYRENKVQQICWDWEDLVNK